MARSIAPEKIAPRVDRPPSRSHAKRVRYRRSAERGTVAGRALEIHQALHLSPRETEAQEGQGAPDPRQDQRRPRQRQHLRQETEDGDVRKHQGQ